MSGHESESEAHKGKTVPAIDPVTGSRCEVLIPHRRIQWAHRLGKGAILELGLCVSEVLLRPRAVFQGLLRDEDDDNDDTDGWRCYSAAPPCRYHYGTGARLPVAGRVLLVFVNEERRAYNHRWEEEDPAEPGLPRDREGRFKERLL